MGTIDFKRYLLGDKFLLDIDILYKTEYNHECGNITKQVAKTILYLKKAGDNYGK